MEVRWLRHAALAGFLAMAAALLLTRMVAGVARSREDVALRWSRPPAKLVRLGVLGRLKSINHAPFEGGNIGAIEHPVPGDETQYVLNLRSDNDDALPKFWRQWWYLKLDDVQLKRKTALTIKGAGQWSYYLPFYSYDNVHWAQFDAREVTQPTRLTLKISHRFEKRQVWLARYVPYTRSKLDDFVDGISRHPDVTVGDIGSTPEGRKIPLITITDASAKAKKLARIVIHARTHPGEVGSSFMLEGLIQFLLGDTSLAKSMRKQLVFSIVPMLNVDGVVAGNNRVNPRGVNLEGKWYPSTASPLELDQSRAPLEVQLMHRLVRSFLSEPTPISVALNLHSSAGEPADNVFFFPHFGPRQKGYGPAESQLYSKQRTFIDALCAAHGKDWFNPPPEDGTRAFLAKSVPETWWWKNFKDQVMALSIESTYGLAGREGRWIKTNDMRRLGASLATAIGRYHGLDIPLKKSKSVKASKALAH